VTTRFRCFALSSNTGELNEVVARRKGIDGMVDQPLGTLVAVDGLGPDELRTKIGVELRKAIEDSIRLGYDRVAITLGWRSDWSDATLDAVDLGIIDGAAALEPFPADWHYPPFVEPGSR
jgi:hypothetical protein